MHKLAIIGFFFAVLTMAVAQNLVHAKSALVIVDMQECFVYPVDKEGDWAARDEKNSLPVAGGRDIVAGINKIQDKFDLVVATKDWHPKAHWSFASRWDENIFEDYTLPNGSKQTLWPDHCVQGTDGADFIAGLDTSKVQDIIYKGTNTQVDSYSGFFDNDRSSQTMLNMYLKEKGVTEVYVVGLAADYCVKFTALDSAGLEYQTYFIEDLTKAVDPSKLDTVKSELNSAGVKVINSSELK